VEATSVTFIDSRTLEAVTPAQTRAGSVPVKVVNPDGLIASQTYGFWYIDETPPVLSYTVIGPQGLNGFYVGDVTITWSASDPESEVRLTGCESRTFTEDGYFYAYCQAESDGGERHEWVYVSRDATSPTIDISWPYSPDPEFPQPLMRGSVVNAYYFCTEWVSGLVSCDGDVPSGEPLDTSTTGTFTLTVRSQDLAGNQSTKQTSYAVVPPTTLTLAAASGEYGSTVVLSATLTSDGAPLAGRMVEFRVSNYSMVTALTGPNGVASVPFPLGTRTVGTYPLEAEFRSDVAYFPSYVTGSLVVTKATPQITWQTPAPIVYPAPLSYTQFNATASVVGNLRYSPNLNTVLSAGVHTLSVVLTPTDSVNYNTAIASVLLTVLKPSASVTWSAPGTIVYGTPLGSAQLNASANYPGSFSYAPAAGTVLGAGVQTLTVTFTPTDPNVNGGIATVPLTVLKASAQLTWNPPVSIVYGTALGAAQLNASSDRPGSFSYSPSAGTVLGAGTHTLSATFEPGDPNVNSGTVSVSLTVVKATPQITWSTPAPITYGTPLGASQLNASASVAGTFVYSPAAGIILGAGTRPLSVTFTPADGSNYQSVSGSVSTVVAPAPLTIRANDATKVYGAPLPAFTSTATGFINGDTLASLAGTLTFSTSASQASTPGSYAVTAGGVSSPNYTIAFQNGTLTVTKAATTMTLSSSPSPSLNNKPVTLTATVAVTAPGSGTRTGTVEFRDKGTLLGTAPIVNGSASLTVSLRKGSHPLTASWTGDANFTGSNAAITHQVN
jgi:hypothetical protein